MWGLAALCCVHFFAVGLPALCLCEVFVFKRHLRITKNHFSLFSRSSECKCPDRGTWVKACRNRRGWGPGNKTCTAPVSVHALRGRCRWEAGTGALGRGPPPVLSHGDAAPRSPLALPRMALLPRALGVGAAWSLRRAARALTCAMASPGEPQPPAAAAAASFDYLVIGGGSGGLASARRAAELGARAAVVESHKLGGTCVSTGALGPRRLHTLSRPLRAAPGVLPHSRVPVPGGGGKEGNATEPATVHRCSANAKTSAKLSCPACICLRGSIASGAGARETGLPLGNYWWRGRGEQWRALAWRRVCGGVGSGLIFQFKGKEIGNSSSQLWLRIERNPVKN